jgi:hypothetical protein
LGIYDLRLTICCRKETTKYTEHTKRGRQQVFS